jgi:hypothetical protein
MFVAPLFLEINLNYGVERFSLLGFFKQDPDDNEDNNSNSHKTDSNSENRFSVKFMLLQYIHFQHIDLHFICTISLRMTNSNTIY